MSCILFLTACGPSPDAVCDKMIELAKKENEAIGKKLEEDKSECVEQMESAKEMHGMVEFRKEAKCVMDASTLEEASKCD